MADQKPEGDSQQPIAPNQKSVSPPPLESLPQQVAMEIEKLKHIQQELTELQTGQTLAAAQPETTAHAPAGNYQSHWPPKSSQTYESHRHQVHVPPQATEQHEPLHLAHQAKHKVHHKTSEFIQIFAELHHTFGGNGFAHTHRALQEGKINMHRLEQVENFIDILQKFSKFVALASKHTTIPQHPHGNLQECRDCLDDIKSKANDVSMCISLYTCGDCHDLPEERIFMLMGNLVTDMANMKNSLARYDRNIKFRRNAAFVVSGLSLAGISGWIYQNADTITLSKPNMLFYSSLTGVFCVAPFFIGLNDETHHARVMELLSMIESMKPQLEILSRMSGHYKTMKCQDV